MAKKTKPTTVPITKVSIENVSKWPTMYAVYMVSERMQCEIGYIMSNRDVGCTFMHVDGVTIAVLPVSKVHPADTLFFYIHDREEKE